MSLSLYDISVTNKLQILNAVTGFLEKSRIHFKANGIALDDIVRTRLYPDMLPFRFQVLSVVHHSLGAIQGVQAGVFSPPKPAPEVDYQGLQKLVANAYSEMQQLTPETINALEGKDMEFKMGDFRLPFTSEDFLLSFSLPNFYFHATTTYDILRMKGVPLGKRDFTGKMRTKTDTIQ